MQQKAAKKRSDWTDLNRDGKRLDKLIKMLETRVNPSRKRKVMPEPLPDEIKLAYIDRIIKLTHEKRGIVDTVLGVNELLKEMKIR
jgi:hypothetical protein